MNETRPHVGQAPHLFVRIGRSLVTALSIVSTLAAARPADEAPESKAAKALSEAAARGLDRTGLEALARSLSGEVPGLGPVSAPESALAVLPLAAGAAQSFFVPIVLSAAGASNSFYTSEMTLTNKGATNVGLEFVYTAAFGGGSGTRSDTLAPGRQKVVPDTIAYLRSLGLPIPGEGGQGGTLLVRFSGLASPADGFVTVRTTTAVPEGRAGLAYSGVTAAAALTTPSLPDSSALASGTFRPTNIGGSDAFPAPAPVPSSASALSVFNGTNPNGTWSLYAVDDTSGDSGRFAGGWCLNVTTSDGSTQQQCNSTSISVPGSGSGASTGAPASPYPSNVTVAGLSGTVSKVTVTLNGYTHGWPDDVDVLLVGPAGQNLVLMSDVGGSADANALTLSFDDTYAAAWLCGLRQNANDRSNVAIANGGEAADGSIVIRLTVISGVPGQPFSRTLPDETLPPGGFKQFSGILGDYGLTSGYVKVERVAGTAPWTTYAVFNDQKNSDGSFVPALPVGANLGKTLLIVPVMVETGTFTSELVVTNLSASAKTLNLSYVSDNITTSSSTATTTLSVAAGEQVILPDFVVWLRGKSVTGIPAPGPTLAGALFVSVTSGDVSGLFVGARTSAPGGGGRYGLFYPAVPAGGGLTDKAWLYGLQQNSENRTNVALVNTGEKNSTTDVFKIDFFNGDTGALAGTADNISLAPKRWTQLGSVLSQAAPGVTNAYALITLKSGTNPFLSYEVLNDGEGPGARSGDGAFVGAQIDCTYEISSTGRTFGWSGGSASTSLTAPDGCFWSASSDASWLTLAGASGGSGDATVSYAVASNNGSPSRTGALNVAGRLFTVTQLGNSPGSYDGNWAGTTSQSRPISFTILKNEMTLLGMGISATLGPCSVDATFTGAQILPPPVVVNAAFTASATIGGSGGAFVLDLSGTFKSASSASGTAGVPLIITGGTICFGFGSGTTWNATK